MRNHWLFAIMLGTASLWPLLNGLKLFITKKPFLFAAHMNFLFIMISFSPLFIPVLFDEFKINLNQGFDPGFYFFILLYGGMSFYWWIGTRGYVVVGVTEDSLRESLKYVLKRLKIDFKELPSGFQLTKDNANLSLNIQRWAGIGRLELEGVKDKSVLKDIAKGLREYFVLSPPKVNFRAGTFDIIHSLVFIGLIIAVYVRQ